MSKDFQANKLRILILNSSLNVDEKIEVLKYFDDLVERASPFYKYSINQIRQWFGLNPIKYNEILTLEELEKENNFIEK